MINGRRKGNAAELAVARELSRLWCGVTDPRIPVEKLPFRRRYTIGTPLDGTWAGAGDILSLPSVDFPFCVEVKHYAQLRLDSLLSGAGQIPDWWEQCAKQAASVSKLPLLFFKGNRTPLYVMYTPEGTLHVKPPKHHSMLWDGRYCHTCTDAWARC